LVKNLITAYRAVLPWLADRATWVTRLARVSGCLAVTIHANATRRAVDPTKSQQLTDRLLNRNTGATGVFC